MRAWVSSRHEAGAIVSGTDHDAEDLVREDAPVASARPLLARGSDPNEAALRRRMKLQALLMAAIATLLLAVALAVPFVLRYLELQLS